MDDPSLLWPLVIAFVTFAAAGFGAPVPEELAIIAAGIWTAANPQFGPARWLMLPVSIAGVLVADILLYTFGRFFGTRLLNLGWVRRCVPPEKQVSIRENFHQYGVKLLLFGRLLPGIRVPLFLTAGMMHLSVPRFIFADALGAVLGNGLLFLLAFWFGDAFRDLVLAAENEVKKPQVLILIAIVFVAGYFLYRFLRQPVLTGDPKELPLIGEQVAHLTESHLSNPTPAGEKELPLATDPPKFPRD